MLLLLIGWFVLACVLALVIGPALKIGLDDAPAHLTQRDWDRITERHVPHAVPFRRR